MGPWVFDFRNSVLPTLEICVPFCDVVVGLVPHPACSCQELVEVFVGLNPVHPVPLAQVLEKWSDLAFALEFACATALIAKAGAAAENL